MKVLIETHGCKLNMADTQAIAGQFADAGFSVVDRDDAPDVFVLNSCTVTNVADRKARQALLRARRDYPAAVIVATGCYPTRSAGEVSLLPGVDLVVANSNKQRLVGEVLARLDANDTERRTVRSAAGVLRAVGRSRASVKIQEGCDQVCAYCIVPKVRGRERSIPVDLIVEQIGRLVDSGCMEVVLTGTQLGTYGVDIGDVDLAGLIRVILARTSLARLRISSLQPLEISPDLLSVWNNEGRGRLCPHFHVPLQSGSDRVLEQMRRRYTIRQYEDAVVRIRDAVEGCSITTDVIVGFPGESERDHESTLETIERVGYADCHVFPFSVRPGTSAAHFADQVPHALRSRRSSEVRDLAALHAARFRESNVGSVRPVLWEGRDRRHGFTDNYLRVMRSGVDGQGRGVAIEPVRLLSVAGSSLIGTPVAADTVT